MQSITAASDLIKASDDDFVLKQIMSKLGFPRPPLPLNQKAREKMGLSNHVLEASIVRGDDSLRALIITLAEECNAREELRKISSTLSIHIPHFLWLLILRQKNSTLFAVATLSSHTSTRPKVVALVTYRDQVIESDAESLCGLSAARAISNDVLRHSRWVETLSRESVTQRFYRAIEKVVSQMADSLNPAPPSKEAHTLSLIYTSRLLFLAFLETKGWLNKDFDFLSNEFIRCMSEGGNYHRKVLEPLFFGTLNTRPSKRAVRAHAFGRIPFLNGGLFARTPLEKLYRKSYFTDEALSSMFDNVLTRYRLTAREDSSTWSEAAVDPEMLGRVFESLMASKERKQSGAFYTPQHLVERTTRNALIEALKCKTVTTDTLNDCFAGKLPDDETRGILLDRVSRVSVLDPACGSGAFLVHALETLADLRSFLGDVRPIYAIRRSMLISAIYGVDINPMAVWLCELRLWLSVVIDNGERDVSRILPLPNLDYHIRTGNSLTGGSFSQDVTLINPPSIARLLDRYSRASGVRKRSLSKKLDQVKRERALALLDKQIGVTSQNRRDLLAEQRSPDLFDQKYTSHRSQAEVKRLKREAQRLRAERIRIERGGALPFSFRTHFPHIADRGGFQVILGNPPWVRPHHLPRMSQTERDSLRSSFMSFRNAAWKTGAQNTKAGTGFAAQVDLAALFLERSTSLLAPEGSLGLLLPVKLWKSLSGGGTRQLAMTRLDISRLEDMTEAPAAFDAAAYPSVLVAKRKNATREISHGLPGDTIAGNGSSPTDYGTMTVEVHRPQRSIVWNSTTSSLPFDDSAGAPWLLIHPDVRRAFNTLISAGQPLSHSHLGRPHLGVKTGCNEAFIVEVSQHQPKAASDFIAAQSGSYKGVVDRGLLRPLIRGATVRPWTALPSSSRIIWTHDSDGAAFNSLPKLTLTWLSNWRQQLTRRADIKPHTIWWSLFRTEAASTQNARVVWSDFGIVPRATMIDKGDPTVPINTCYVVPCKSRTDALTLTAILNSPLIAAWLDVLAEPAQNSYRRYLGWTMALLPVPNDWALARRILAPISRRALYGNQPGTEELYHATLRAYGIDHESVSPLMDWTEDKSHTRAFN